MNQEQQLTEALSAQEQMIREQVIERGLREPRLLAALRAVPRERFFPVEQRNEAFADRASPIGHGQTISQPFMVALMTHRLDVQPDHRVLEVGTGSGYQTAILANLARDVFTIERMKPLLDEAWERLMDLKIRNVHFRFGDGTLGWPEAAPFDRILIAAGAPTLPRALLMNQLRDGGVAVLPVGPHNEQMLVSVSRRGDELIEEQVTPVRFVKLIGQEGWSDDEEESRPDKAPDLSPTTRRTGKTHAVTVAPHLTADSPVESLKGVGPTRAKYLRELGLQRLGDLLEYFPRAYQTELPEQSLRGLVDGQIQSARGTVVAVNYVPIRPRPRFEATIQDQSGEKMSLVWFNGAYLRTRIHPGVLIRVRGRVGHFRGLPQMSNPKWELIDESTPSVDTRAYNPIYPASSRISSQTIATVIADNIEPAIERVPELFDGDLLKLRGLVSRREAYRLIHRPRDWRDAQAARRRIVYDELMLLQLGLGLSRRLRDGRLTAPVLRADKLLDQRIRARFPFDLTNAQQNAVWQIVTDLQSGHPMNRLLQGDVGSGKTVVALYAMLVAVANKMQSAILAPTEVLAEQHFLTLSNFLRGSSVRIELLTNRTKRASRGKLSKAIANGQVHLAVGTQALIQEDVEFANLGLVVIDEQHKLGVKQRAVLKGMGHSPHYLVMTATPIPRTLALSYFADFDISIIDELPPGRQPIHTRWLKPKDASKAYEFVRKQVEAGRQAYIVLPQIDDDGLDESKSVKKEFDRLQKGPLHGLRLKVLHGQLDTEEKQATMNAFRDGSIDVLVATTVIEVGVDVANATVMLIDGAERFGLSQLHQLRGRVGRGAAESHCILLSEASTETAIERLRAMTQTNDGFEIAEMDLQLRGPGEFFGTRQHGLPEMKLADITQEIGMLQVARDDALRILESDAKLSRAENTALRTALQHKFGDAIGLAQVG